MAHYEINLFLVVVIHRFAFQHHTPNEPMVVLTGTLLSDLARIAVEETAELQSRIGIRYRCAVLSYRFCYVLEAFLALKS